jgi:hypothetical protein
MQILKLMARFVEIISTPRGAAVELDPLLLAYGLKIVQEG